MNSNDRKIIQDRIAEIRKDLPDWIIWLHEADTEDSRIEGDRIMFKYIDGSRYIITVNVNSNLMEELKNEETWDSFKAGLCNTLKDSLRITDKLDFSDSKSEAFQQIRNHLVIKPMRADDPELSGGEFIYRVIGDIALVLFCELGFYDDQYSGFKVRRIQTEKWEKTDDELIDYALANTVQKYPAVVAAVQSTDENDQSCLLSEIKANEPGQKYEHLMVSLAGDWIFGCSAIFFPPVRKAVSAVLGGDYLITFISQASSVCQRIEPGIYKRILYGIDALKELPGEMISDLVYIYDSEKDEIRPYSEN